MFLRAVCRFIELKAFLASMRRMAWVSLSSKMALIACTAASHPLSSPAHNLIEPVVSSISCLMMESTALLIILLLHSPIPMGLTSGFLSKEASLLATRAVSPEGLTYSVHIRMAHSAKESHRSPEALWKDVQSLLQLAASTPDGPADPNVLSAIDRMRGTLICSKMTG